MEFISTWRCPNTAATIVFLRTGNYCGRIEKDEAVIEYARKNERHPDCHLVPVPPHGRLIDADKLEKSFREDADAEWNRFAAPVNWADAFDDVANIVADAPTVIEAEEGE